MTKRVAIVQSNYVPWKGYFDLIHSVDEFVLLDTVQFTRRDWRNRNVVKGSDGRNRWLTIPVATKGKYTQRIDEVVVTDPAWANAHWRVLNECYRRSPHFDEFAETIEQMYVSAPSPRLTDINQHFLDGLCRLLEIKTPVSVAPDLEVTDPTERLVALCRRAGASHYVSGPAARDYLDVSRFNQVGIDVEWFDYSGYREYPQPGEFDHHVSVVDVLFQAGPDAKELVRRG